MARYSFGGQLTTIIASLAPCLLMSMCGCEKHDAREETADFQAGAAAQTKKDFRGALAHFQAQVANHQKHAEAWLRIGYCYDELGQASEALRAYQEAARCEPEYVQAHVNLGSAYARAGRTDEAMASLREAIRIQPKDAKAHFNLGLLLSKLGQPKEAIEELEKAIRFKSDYAKPHATLVRLYGAQGNKDKVRYHCDRLGKLDGQLAASVCGTSSSNQAEAGSGNGLIEDIRLWEGFGCPFNEGLILVARLNRAGSSAGEAKSEFCRAVQRKLKALSVAPPPVPVEPDEDVEEELIDDIESMGHLAKEARCSRGG